MGVGRGGEEGDEPISHPLPQAKHLRYRRSPCDDGAGIFIAPRKINSMDEFIKGLYAKIARGGQLPPDFGLSPGDFPRLDEIPLDITGHEATQQARDPRQQRNVVIEDGEVAEEPEYSAPAQASRLPEQRKIYKGKVRVVLPYGIIIRPDDRTYKDVTVEITQISHDLRLFDNDTDGDRIATIKREISEGDAAWVKVIAIKQDDRGEQQALGSMKVVSQTDGEDFDPLGLFLKQEGSTTVAKPELVEPPRRGGNNSIPANGRTANGAAALRVRGANASISTPKGGIKKLPPPKMLQRQPAAQQQARQQFAQQIAQQQARQQQQQQLQQQQVQNKTKSPQNKARPPNSKNEIVDGQPEEGEVYMDTTTVGEVPNSNNNGTARYVDVCLTAQSYSYFCFSFINYLYSQN